MTEQMQIGHIIDKTTCQNDETLQNTHNVLSAAVARLRCFMTSDVIDINRQDAGLSSVVRRHQVQTFAF